jgi:hypothetical protein
MCCPRVTFQDQCERRSWQLYDEGGEIRVGKRKVRRKAYAPHLCNRLGVEDLNLGIRIQSPLSYR